MKNVKIAVFGEILWDIFGEEKTIGGAPFNFAAHSSKLGADVELISAVGNDALGADAVAAARGFGVGVNNIASVGAPTGYCRVTLRDGKPSYELVRGVAYDMIPSPEREIVADAFYFGTLAQRGDVSASTLRTLLNGNYREVFFDINIRQNFYTDAMIDESLKRATIFKLSREESAVVVPRHATLADARSEDAVTGPRHAMLADARSGDAVTEPRHATLADARSGDAVTEPHHTTLADARSGDAVLGVSGNEADVCKMIAAKYPNLRLVILTLDCDGAIVYEPSTGKIYRSPMPTSTAVSTVGAGDSFSACFLVNYLSGEGIEVSLRRATVLSDYVVTRLGAVPDYPEDLFGEGI